MPRDYLSQRGTMYSWGQRSPRFDNRPRPRFEVPDPEDVQTSTSNRGVIGLNVIGLIVDALNRHYENVKAEATAGLRREIREQLAPGQIVEVQVNDFDYWSESYGEVVVGEPVPGQGLRAQGTESLKVRSDKPASDPDEPPQDVFILRRDGRFEVVRLVRSPSDDRPGRLEVEIRERIERWNRDPGTMDLDLRQANTG